MIRRSTLIAAVAAIAGGFTMPAVHCQEPLQLKSRIWPFDMVVSPRGDHFVTCDPKEHIVVWSLKEPGAKTVWNLGRDMRPTKISEGEEAGILWLVARLGVATSVYRLRMETGACEKVRDIIGVPKAFHKDLALAAIDIVKRPTEIRCSNLKLGKLLLLNAPGKGILQTGFSHDGAAVVALNDENELLAWDYPSGKERWRVKVLASTHGFLFTPDSKRVLTIRTPLTSIWDMQTGKSVVEKEWLIPKAIHPDSKHAIERADDGWVFKTINPVKEVARITHPHGRWGCKHLAFTPDGRKLIGAGTYGEIRIWDVPKLNKDE